MLRRILAALLAPALGVLLALAAAPPSHANLPPGPVESFSVARTMSALGSCAAQTGANVQVGGWNARSFLASANAFPAPTNGGVTIPVRISLGELCMDSSNRLAVQYDQIASPMVKTNNDGWARMAFDITRIDCVSPSGTFTSQVGLHISRQTSQSTGPFGNELLTSSSTPMQNTTWLASNCDRIIRVAGEARIPTIAGNTLIVTIEWSAARFLGNTEYGTPTPPGSIEYCAENPLSFLCDGIVEPDPGSFESTCGEVDNADFYGIEYAAFNPVDVETWGPATAWLAVCLFVPLPNGGFDREGRVADSWANSPNSEAGIAIVNMANTWRFASNCGPLFSAPADSPLGAFSVNTCSWSWAEPVRAVLGAGVLALGLFWFISYVISAVGGVIRKSVPSPVEGADRG